MRRIKVRQPSRTVADLIRKDRNVMEFEADREMAERVAYRVTWFAPDRPVDGGTVFVRPATPPGTDRPVVPASPRHDDQN